MPGIKPWSLSTTVRNPERLPGFLSALAEIEGEVWNPANQERFQVILIQKRQYGAHSSQFSSGLSAADVALLDGEDEIPFADARRIFLSKDYKDPPMRGRNSYKPLEKLGFAAIHPLLRQVQITPLGRELMTPGVDLGDVFLRSLLKWQLPNPVDAHGFPARLGYRVKPFVATLHLIKKVNDLCNEQGLNATGLSFDEFDAFVPTLIDWEKLDEVARKIVEIRVACRGISGAEREARQQSLIAEAISGFDRQHLRDYGDNARRYFRLTRFIRYRGNGRFVDMEPRRAVEIESLLESDSAQPQDFQGAGYHEYLCDPDLPILPWQNYAELILIYQDVIAGISQLDAALALKLQADCPAVADEKILSANIEVLRKQWRDLQRQAESLSWQTAEKTREVARTLAGLTKPRSCTPTDLEYHVASALMSLDAAKEVIPNYPVGDDNLPTFTAPGGVSDIECFYEGFNLACEVTLMRDSKQWVHEGYPVLRHVYDFLQAHGGTTYGLFIAPALHEDTIGVFWGGTRGVYKGENINVFPLTISKFARLLETCADFRAGGGVVSLADVAGLFNGLATATADCPDSRQWTGRLDAAVDAWCGSLRPAGG